MRNPELTRHTILEKSSVLFNTKGYKATSLSEICAAAKLTKGAIYKHFEDKAQLEKEALLFMCTKLLTDLGSKISDASTVKDKLYAIIQYFEDYHTNPPFTGGCPLMNASIEVDDSNSILKEVVKNIMEILHQNLSKVIQNGIKHKQILPETDSEGLASIIISTLEGAVMMMQMMNTNKHMTASSKYLKAEIQRILI